MKRLFYTSFVSVVFCFSIVFFSCSSTDECCDDEVITTVIKQTDTVYVPPPVTGIKLYSVQIGAFANKSNADAFFANAKSAIGIDVKMVQSKDGIFRILIGEYKSIEEANITLQKVLNKGYRDSFIRDESGPVK